MLKEIKIVDTDTDWAEIERLYQQQIHDSWQNCSTEQKHDKTISVYKNKSKNIMAKLDGYLEKDSTWAVFTFQDLKERVKWLKHFDFLDYNLTYYSVNESVKEHTDHWYTWTKINYIVQGSESDYTYCNGYTHYHRPGSAYIIDASKPHGASITQPTSILSIDWMKYPIKDFITLLTKHYPECII